MLRRLAACLVLALSLCISTAHAGDFAPDPASVQRDGPAYRYPQAGWIVLHVEGQPYERGHQQGKLLWREIQQYVNCFAMEKSSKSPSEGWALMRTLTNALFVRRFDPEYLEEMKGIADGAASAGAKFDGRPLDLTDIVAINAWPEILTLEDALHAQPNGLEGRDFGKPADTAKRQPHIDRCSAFAATGSATRDGKPVIGHITMFDQYSCNYFNVWIDVKPANGHRVVFQAAPGSIQSGMDWYINDAGIVLTETTIEQTRYNPDGLSIGSRSRRAMQYGDSVDTATHLLAEGGNGLYTNEWLLADMHTNEIALFELGTKTSRLMRSSKDEWFGSTKGFYWGCNNTKDLAVRLETLSSTDDKPADMTFCPEPRDKEWVRLFGIHHGTIDDSFGKLAFSKPPLVTGHSCDAKYTTAALALKMSSFAHWGNPSDHLWDTDRRESEQFPDARPIVPNDWTVVTTNAPAAASPDAPMAVDLQRSASDSDEDSAERPDGEPPTAWHGTILPAGDGDIWLASAFAKFQEHVALENQLSSAHSTDKSNADKPGAAKPGSTTHPTTGPSVTDAVTAASKMDVGPSTESSDPASSVLTPAERDLLSMDRFEAFSAALTFGYSANSTPLSKIRSNPADDAWFHSAIGRGCMLLSDLRLRIGPEKFDGAMDTFGRAHSGQAVSTQAFIAAMNAASPVKLDKVFSNWIDGINALPTLKVSAVSFAKTDGGFAVTGKVISTGGCTPAAVDVTVESADDETTKSFQFNKAELTFRLNCDSKPTRVTVNKYANTPCTNGCRWGVSSFRHDLEQTLIVYGTRAESAGNHIAARKLQEGLTDQWEHATLPMKADTDVTDADLKGQHILLIGRPACSSLIERLATAVPVVFGPQSFTVRSRLYANADSAVLVAGENPMDARFSVVFVSGLSPGATLRAAKSLADDWVPAPVRILTAQGKSKDLVPPASELVQELR